MEIILGISAAFIVTFIVLPIVIKVSKSIDLLDNPDQRKIHATGTPSLGGIAIFLGFSLAVLITIPLSDLSQIKFFLFGLMVMVFLGVRDDVANMTAKHKLVVQLFCASVVVYFSDIQLSGFYNIFGIGDLPTWFNIPFSIFVIVALTNSLNLIDGIDGLAGSVGILVLGFLGWFFLMTNQTAYAVICISLVGSLIAFLFYNWNPSKIFMGDTGSLSMGFVISCLTIHFINLAGEGAMPTFPLHSSVGVGMSLLILPISDTLRVFVIRFMNGKNPLDPDRNHLHHGLLKMGMNHSKATITLVSFNTVILVMAIYLNQYLTNGELILAVGAVVVLFSLVFEFRLSRLKYQKRSVTTTPNLYISKSA